MAHITTTSFFSCLLVLGTGCSSSLLGGGVHEGVIDYAITFPDMDPNGLTAGMLPSHTFLSFNEEHQSVELSAGMGIFHTAMVVNTQDKVVDYHMSVMGKNLVAELRPRDLLTYNGNRSAYAVLGSTDTDTIAGYVCKKATIIYEMVDQPEEEVWYTDEIKMDNPNWYGPYSEITGVLMRYEFTQHNIRMRMEATSVTPGPVDASKFQLLKDHERVSPEVLYQQLDEVLGTFSN